VVLPAVASSSVMMVSDGEWECEGLAELGEDQSEAEP
jgi:hypothetical protein